MSVTRLNSMKSTQSKEPSKDLLSGLSKAERMDRIAQLESDLVLQKAPYPVGFGFF